MSNSSLEDPDAGDEVTDVSSDLPVAQGRANATKELCGILLDALLVSPDAWTDVVRADLVGRCNRLYRRLR